MSLFSWLFMALSELSKPLSGLWKCGQHCQRERGKCEGVIKRWLICKSHFHSSLQLLFSLSSTLSEPMSCCLCSLPLTSADTCTQTHWETCTQGALTLLCHTLPFFLNISPANYYFMCYLNVSLLVSETLKQKEEQRV